MWTGLSLVVQNRAGHLSSIWFDNIHSRCGLLSFTCCLLSAPLQSSQSMQREIEKGAAFLLRPEAKQLILGFSSFWLI